ncbi:N-acetylmuramoyl-L-alanine amidase [Orenia metallireducens]|uniref:N-acetylmuramoyl-L-alanine amidase n=1 Tax=Orenia metallireducens TaxID=1413210 RepID=A0A285I2F2_9FIRM|nr:N-acetylmuramoyl-L-alanine amidase [Orenia metallireducens]PRX23256.1 N-acetylmuramoyl-L-alanine amidase [Orenia metallireducens]SNY42139.1 N-acetylmuramoyl-L-alanine amidase [Orenia metallireducens]
MKIIIDPGHGGKDAGAVGEFSCEKDINLKLAKLIEFLLEHLGYEVKLTRDKNCLPIWAERVESSEEDIFISIHCNGAPNESAQGIETFYYVGSKQGKQLAQSIHKSLIKVTESVDRLVKDNDDLYVLKRTKCPAVLVEVGFITNQYEEKLLNSAEYQLKLALAVVKGIESSL